MSYANDDNEVTDNRSNTCDSNPDSNETFAIPATAGGSTSKQPDTAGSLPLFDKSRPKHAPNEKLTAVPPDGKYADVPNDGIAVIEFTKDNTDKVCSVLDELGTHYGAVASKTKVRLFFQNRNIHGCYDGIALCGIPAIIAGDKGYLKPMEGSVEVLHMDDEYSMVPLWLYPVEDCKPLNSSASLVGERKWIKYMKQVYNWLKKYGRDAYANMIETAKILNRHFRRHPFNEQRMTSFLALIDIEHDMQDFYEDETDRNGNTKSVFQKDEFAEWFIERYHLINLNHVAYRYSNGVYIPTLEADCSDLLLKYLKNSTSRERQELMLTVYSLLGIHARGTTSEPDMYYDMKARCKPEMIAFNNGIYDISTGEWTDFSPEIIITNRIPIDYVDFGEQIGSGVKTEAMKIIDNWLDSFSEDNPKKRAVLEEVAGLALYHRNMGLRRQHTILVGIKESGKSTFIKMVERLVGEENCCHASMEDICNPDNRFCTYSLIGKILNSYADLSNQKLKSTARLKNICTSDPIQVEEKHIRHTDLTWEGKMLYGCNNLPIINDEALTDRFEIIPCNAKYDSPDRPCNRDLYGGYLLKPDCLQYWCYLAVQGLKRFIANNYNHTCCEEIELFRKKYIHQMDSFAAFIGSLTEDEIDGHETGEIFSKYINYCENELKLPANTIKQFTKNSFTASLKKHNYITKRKSVNNNKIQVYVKCS